MSSHSESSAGNGPLHWKKMDTTYLGKDVDTVESTTLQ